MTNHDHLAVHGVHDLEALSALTLGALPESAARDLEAHLAGCADCCDDYDDLRRDLLDTLADVEPEVLDTTRADPDDLLGQRIIRAIRREKRAQQRRQRLPAIVAAAVAVLVALAGSYGLGRATAPQSPILSAAGGQTVLATGTDGATLRATITPSGKWVRVVASAHGFPHGQRCQVVLLTAKGQRQFAASWTVPPTGEPDGGLEFGGSAAVEFATVRAVTVENIDTGEQLAYAPV